MLVGDKNLTCISHSTQYSETSEEPGGVDLCAGTVLGTSSEGQDSWSLNS